jgi:excisionase family DNA binding protein
LGVPQHDFASRRGFGYRPAQDDSARRRISVPNDNHETLKVREVAAILRCGRNQAYELIQRGEIRSVRIGRAIRVTREALEEFKAGREAAAQAR